MKLPRSKIRNQKFYRRVKRRVAKKMVARLGPLAWKQLTLSCNLDEGDLIHTRKGYNQKIEKIEPDAWFTKKGWVIYDLDITLEDGGGCSLQHCCTLPMPSKEWVLNYWKYLAKLEDGEWTFGEQHQRLLKAVKNGEDPFDENGCLLESYVVKYDSPSAESVESKPIDQPKICHHV